MNIITNERLNYIFNDNIQKNIYFFTAKKNSKIGYKKRLFILNDKNILSYYDTINGNTPTLSQVTITQISTTNPGVNVNPNDGSVNVSSNTPGGTYYITSYYKQLVK